jgi:hypothetical protein
VSPAHTAYPRAPASTAQPPGAASTPAASSEAPALDARSVLESLQQLLVQGDVDAQAYVRTHRALLQATLGPAFPRLNAAVQGFDFEVAANVLNSLINAQINDQGKPS